jgi:ketosteroid isomerase-like protein
MAPDKPVQSGREAVRNYYQPIFDEYNTGLKSHYEEVEVSGDVAYGRGFAEVILTQDVEGTYSNLQLRTSTF